MTYARSMPNAVVNPMLIFNASFQSLYLGCGGVDVLSRQLCWLWQSSNGMFSIHWTMDTIVPAVNVKLLTLLIEAGILMKALMRAAIKGQ